MTPKPIVVIYYNHMDDMGVPTFEVQNILDRRLNDYHVLVVPAANRDDPFFELKVFYEKDFTPIQYEELKQLILESIEKTNNE